MSYEKITDVFSSNKPQTLIHLTLDNGEQVTATEGHPFKTVDGWRDTVLLKKGGQLLLKGGDADAERLATIVDVSSEQKTLPVFNLEVANAHTFFVGEEGVLVHNAKNKGGYRECNKGWAFAEKVFDRITGGKWTQRGKYKVGNTADGKTANLHSSSSKNTKGHPTIEVRNPDGSSSSKHRD